MRAIDAIILHCSATPEGKEFHVSDIDRWHKEQGWKCVGYHYIITLDGKVERGRSLDETGAHCVGHNVGSIGICYIGGCTKDNKNAKDTRTKAQKNTMYQLVDDLLNHLHLTINNVRCHNQYDKKKACPSFSIDTFKKEYSKWHKTAYGK